jgi:hypothetical protein
MAWYNIGGAVAGAVVTGVMADDGSAPSSNTSSATTMTPQQQAVLNQLLGQYTEGTTKQLATGTAAQAAQPSSYTGAFAAPLSNLQNMSLSSIEQLSQKMSDPAYYQTATDSLNSALSGKAQDITDVFQKSVVDPLTAHFQDVVLPGVIGNFSGQGAYGSDKQKQLQLALSDLGSNISSAGSTLVNNANTTAKQLQGTALSQASNILSSGLNNQVTALNAGGVPTAQSQLGITNALQAWQNQQNLATQVNTSNAAQQNTLTQSQLAALISAMGLKGTENITTVNPGSQGFMTTAASGVGKAVGNAAADYFNGKNKNTTTNTGGAVDVSTPNWTNE